MRLEKFINKLSSKDLVTNINLERPNYVQPEDRIMYRAHRILIILGMLNTKNGLSKDVIACVDFLLRNSNYQKKFILEYFQGQKNIIEKISKYSSNLQEEIDLNIVQYRSVPWDLRFNDMFLFLYIRSLIEITGNNKDKNLRLHLSETGLEYFNGVKEIFPTEVNFLELFGSKVQEIKTIEIITDIIPKSYWRQNEKSNN
ncbi:hypothetical protein [Sunxiuqinia elliptica]|uniref:Uncharacterized protein n=1 Tax=Sunxiuqinia elliptica TaxID=655355 RepID=A0A4R6GZX0_9BACT|nr:hypothetical protein [Sunxiuqinia elliptica]TDO01242.1 hypothetical protein DET52_10597 [Sunxiuqinia elliptica]TDO57753.1 hypothetical protein DET65_3347 [Sunxiuqinia elliptica]